LRPLVEPASADWGAPLAGNWPAAGL